MRKDVSADEAIAHLEESIEKYGAPDDLEPVRCVLAGPPHPLGVDLPDEFPDIGNLNMETLDNPEVNRIFQGYVEAYIQNGGEPNPSPAILEFMRIGAELQVLRVRQLGQILEGSVLR